MESSEIETPGMFIASRSRIIEIEVSVSFAAVLELWMQSSGWGYAVTREMGTRGTFDVATCAVIGIEVFLGRVVGFLFFF